MSALASTIWYCVRSLPSSFFACTWRRIARSVAACALPRPSATASAKFANSTVSQSQAAIASTKAGLPASGARPNSAARPITVVSALPT